jgi:hypothetical protein
MPCSVVQPQQNCSLYQLYQSKPDIKLSHECQPLPEYATILSCLLIHVRLNYKRSARYAVRLGRRDEIPTELQLRYRRSFEHSSLLSWDLDLK